MKPSVAAEKDLQKLTRKSVEKEAIRNEMAVVIGRYREIERVRETEREGESKRKREKERERAFKVIRERDELVHSLVHECTVSLRNHLDSFNV